MLAAYGSARMIVGKFPEKNAAKQEETKMVDSPPAELTLEKDFDFVKLFWCLLICSTDSQYPKKMVGKVSLFSR